MESKVHGDLRVLEIDMGGTLVIPATGLSDESKGLTRPLGLTLWAPKVNMDRW